jgi:hypothetical protein
MPNIIKRKKSIREQKEKEVLTATVAKLRAENDYIAMMCGLDMSDSEARDNHEEKN